MKATIYTRISTRNQNESSIADQVRVCTEYAKRQGWLIVEHYSDAGISGGAMGNRPAFLRMSADATAGRFTVLLITDTTRLARSQDLAPLVTRLRHRGVRVIGVQDGFDSEAGTADMQAGLSGIMSVEFRRMIKARTHAAHESLAKDGAATGGKAYGYIAARDAVSRAIEIDSGQKRKSWPEGRDRDPVLVTGSDQAAIVREVFQLFADGHGYRVIAAKLNARKVPSPGSSWARVTRRTEGWMGSAIRDMLLNERYAGRVHWNTSEWRKDPDSGKRLRIARPRSEWITRDMPELRIIPDELWQRARSRLALKRDVVRKRAAKGMSAASAKSTGRGPRYMLSGLLKCDKCGAAYVVMGKDRYGCLSHVNGGDSLCDNNATLKRQMAEKLVVAGIKRVLQDPVALAEIVKRLRAKLRKPKVAAPDNEAQLKKLRSEIGHLVAAIGGGALRSSAALGARLAAAEEELATLESVAVETAPGINVERLLADLPARARKAVDQLDVTLASGDVTATREELRGHVGVVSVDADRQEIRLFSEGSGFAAALVRGNGTHTSNCGSGGRI